MKIDCDKLKMNIVNPGATTKKKKVNATNQANSGNKMKSELCDSIQKKVIKEEEKEQRTDGKTTSKMLDFTLIASIITLIIKNQITQIEVRDWQIE